MARLIFKYGMIDILKFKITYAQWVRPIDGCAFDQKGADSDPVLRKKVTLPLGP